MRATYFSHDEDARSDPKMIKIRTQYGMEGYGCFFAILEMFSSESAHSLDYSQEQFDAICFDLHTKLDVPTFIDRCIEIGLFQSDNKKFWSDSFNRRIDEVKRKAEERSSNAARAAAARWKGKQKECQSNAPALLEHSESIAESTDFPDATIDPEWRRVVVSYEQQIGLFPVGTAGEKIISYYDDMGADVMIEAIKVTNMAHPDNPARYLMAVLNKWLDVGIKTAEQAQAAVKEHERKKEVRAKRNSESEPQNQSQQIGGKFY